jgi:hypothetical protein
MQPNDLCAYYPAERITSFLSKFSCGDDWILSVSPCGTLSIQWDVTFDRLKELCKEYNESLWIVTGKL